MSNEETREAIAQEVNNSQARQAKLPHGVQEIIGDVLEQRLEADKGDDLQGQKTSENSQKWLTDHAAEKAKLACCVQDQVKIGEALESEKRGSSLSKKAAEPTAAAQQLNDPDVDQAKPPASAQGYFQGVVEASKSENGATSVDKELVGVA